MKFNSKTSPASRPLRLFTHDELKSRWAQALSNHDGVVGAHCVHELWMRGEMGINVESMLKRLWERCGESVPDWLPMRHIEWLPAVYEVTARFGVQNKGRSNIYLILLDYSDSRADTFGIYVGMTSYAPAQRFDQHKAGIRAAGSVLKRGLELLSGPALHLQRIRRADAERIEVELAEALTAAGLFVQGGH